jgi:hypothetical protein
MLPAGDAGGERGVDVLERGFGCGAGGGVVRLANAGEDAAGFGFAGGSVVACFEAEEGVLEGQMKVGWREAEGLAELLASSVAVACFQERVAEVFADVGARGSEGRGFFEVDDGGVIVVKTQRIESEGECCVGGIGGGGIGVILRQRGGGDQKKGCEANGRAPTRLVGPRGGVLRHLRTFPRAHAWGCKTSRVRLRECRRPRADEGVGRGRGAPTMNVS